MTPPHAPAPGSARCAAVLGHPVAHSLSPSLHLAAYARLGLTGWTYRRVDVQESQLPDFLAAVAAEGGPERWAGLSLTMPLKRTVRPLLAAESDLARRVGAVNTVIFGDDGPVGENTDVHGIVAALAEGGLPGARRGVVLGGGATAASAVAALAELGCTEPRVLVRSPERTGDLRDAAERLGVRLRVELLGPAEAAAAVGDAEVVISTLPAGAADPLAGPELAAAVRAGTPVLLDVVYHPWPTALARHWEQSGGAVVSGFEMLVHQAAAQVELMTGHRAPVAVMREAGLAEMRARAAAD